MELKLLNYLKILKRKLLLYSFLRQRSYWTDTGIVQLLEAVITQQAHESEAKRFPTSSPSRLQVLYVVRAKFSPLIVILMLRASRQSQWRSIKSPPFFSFRFSLHRGWFSYHHDDYTDGDGD
jgi:hypothetical protein